LDCIGNAEKTQNIAPKTTGKKFVILTEKIFKKLLTHLGVLLYDIKAPVRAQSAMMQEIARNAR